MNVITTFFKIFGSGLLLLLGATLLIAVSVGPIVGSILLASTIGYWWFVLLGVAIVWCGACWFTAAITIYNFVEERP